MFFIAYPFKGQVHVFAVRVKIVSHLSCRTSAIFKYFCPLLLFNSKYHKFLISVIKSYLLKFQYGLDQYTSQMHEQKAYLQSVIMFCNHLFNGACAVFMGFWVCFPIANTSQNVFSLSQILQIFNHAWNCVSNVNFHEKAIFKVIKTIHFLFTFCKVYLQYVIFNPIEWCSVSRLIFIEYLSD